MDLWEAIDILQKNTHEDGLTKDKATIAFLYQALTEDVILQVAGCETAKELWESLKRRHVGEEKVQQARLQSLMIGFQTLEMKEDDTEDKWKARKTYYSHMANTLEKEGNLVIAEVDQTFHEEITRQSNRNNMDSNEESSTHKGKSNRNKHEWDMSKVRCYKCGKLGHFRKNCKESSTTQKQSNLILEDDEPSLLMTTHETEHEEVFVGMMDKIHPGNIATSDASMWTYAFWRWIIEEVSLHLMNYKYCKEIRIALKVDSLLTTTKWSSGEKKQNSVINYEEYDESDEVTINFLGAMEAEAVRQAFTLLNRKRKSKATISSLRNSEDQFDDTPVRGFKDRMEIYQNAREVETETLLFTEEEPRNYKEASTYKKWIEAMEIELDSINKNNTWTLTTLPTNQKVIGIKWVFKTKRDAKGNIIKYKARLVAKGYIPEQGIDFDEVFAQVARIETVRLILALAAYHGWQVHHLDVKSAFLQQAPRAWNVKLDQTLKSLDFKKCNLEQAVYTKRSKTSTLIVGVYVDDLIITGTPRKEIDLFKSQMEDKFEMSDLGLLAYYLGIEVTQTGGEITIKQSGYINKILKETSMTDSNVHERYQWNPGARWYLLHTRPDLSYSVGLLSRFMQDPKDHHLKAVKQVIRYIKGTKKQAHRHSLSFHSWECIEEWYNINVEKTTSVENYKMAVRLVLNLLQRD
ncbi:ribonuclease H-like domain, reverse transcriptase, RNA-dependent DNA polymerase [Tanacetum coccineum]